MSDAVEAEVTRIRSLIVRQEQLLTNLSEIGAKVPVGSLLHTQSRKRYKVCEENLANSKKLLAELLALLPQTDLESVAPSAPLVHSSPGGVLPIAPPSEPVVKNKKTG